MTTTEDRPMAVAADLVVEDLTVEFVTDGRAATALRGITFSVPSGRFVGVVGETGAGKSVTVRALLGLLPANGHVVAGRATLGDVDLLATNRSELRSIRGRTVGFVPQQPWSALHPILPLARQFGDVVKAHRRTTRAQRRAIAHAALRRVDIADPARVLGSVASELSGGMAQRAAIAMVLQLNPPLIVADEPTTALDLMTQRELLDLLSALCRSDGRSALVVTHDLSVVAQYCDDVVVLRQGVVIESGPVVDVFHAPQNSYTRELLDAAR
jgi:ABC-type dipeptide/oligopeptide/nickel transport system ATPase component